MGAFTFTIQIHKKHVKGVIGGTILRILLDISNKSTNQYSCRPSMNSDPGTRKFPIQK
jgi:hypothetical protein